MDPVLLGRRVKIARIYAQFDDRQDLAAEINQPGLSGAVLGRIERGEKQPAVRDLETIADHCGVSSLWLTNEEYDPFSRAHVTTDSGAGSDASLQAVLHALEELLARDDPKSAALAELRQLRQTNRPANGQSESGRE